MDEQELVRQAFKKMAPKPVVCHVYANPDGTLERWPAREHPH